MTRGLWRTAVLMAVFCALPFGCVAAWWRLSEPDRTDLDKAIMQAGWRPDGDVTDVMVRHLPADFDGAARALREFGFHEGPSYRRPPPPGFDEAELGHQTISHFNDLLDRRDAVSLQRFGRMLPGRLEDGPGVAVFLMRTQDGSMRIFAYLGGGK